ncbi:hypothetical protein C2845_PM08G13690 [Panicum miliaceum]|uniref:Zinc finger GRF-type domain-containing protein n=1 Tax=Panicum miliaceum TaxID=4540 RepID=A0A3L6R1X1_PANMI|nr:hypothetical protein C2845_PM08G13690 [Panicum miliaceum]
MSQASSSSAWRARWAPARVSRGPPPVLLGAPAPLEVVPQPVMDDVTGMPLIFCPSCKDLRLVAFTCKWTENRGRRFFKCPRYDELGAKRRRIYMFQDKYELFLRTKGYLEYAGSELAMDGGPEAMDAVSGLVMEEIEQGGFA